MCCFHQPVGLAGQYSQVASLGHIATNIVATKPSKKPWGLINPASHCEQQANMGAAIAHSSLLCEPIYQPSTNRLPITRRPMPHSCGHQSTKGQPTAQPPNHACCDGCGSWLVAWRWLRLVPTMGVVMALMAACPLSRRCIIN